MLHEKVLVDMEYENKMIQIMNATIASNSSSISHDTMTMTPRRRTKIFCLIYTTDAGHYRIPAIRETWG
jgi:hypothetical protein